MNQTSNDDEQCKLLTSLISYTAIYADGK